MEIKDLINLINSELKPLGYKKKGRKWSIETEELIKDVSIQKSNFSKFYYVNYGFIIKELDLENSYHHYASGLGGITQEENSFVQTFLDFENDENKDVVKFTTIFRANLIADLNSINRIQDLRSHIVEKQFRINMLSLPTKNFLQISVQK
jgi:hypothetical protein